MIGDNTKYNVSHIPQNNETNNVVWSYINGVKGEFALLIYWPSFGIAQSYGHLATNCQNHTTALLCFMVNLITGHMLGRTVWTLKLVNSFCIVSVTCRSVSRSVTAASRCIHGRHGCSRSRCAGAQDSNAWMRRSTIPWCWFINRTSCGGAKTTAECCTIALIFLFGGKGEL